MDAIIKTENLKFEYPGQESESHALVLDAINVEIARGSFTAILGHNGSGKSTLVKHFNAILLPSGGKCYVDGMDTANEELLYEIRRTAGMVFQNPDNQIVASVVDEDVAFAIENLGVPHKEIVERVENTLKAVGMYAFRRHAPHLLSGGQKQRVAIAGIIAMRPSCIILDEPTAMLDPQGRFEVLETISRLKEEYGLTVVLITHHMIEAARADRVIVLKKGRVYMDDTPRAVFSQVERLKEAGLSAPQSVMLMHMLNAAGASLPLDILDEDATARHIYDWLYGGEKR